MPTPTATRKRGLTATEQRDLDHAIELAVSRYGEQMSGPQFQKYANIGPTTANNWRRAGKGPVPVKRDAATERGVRWFYITREVVAFCRGIQA